MVKKRSKRDTFIKNANKTLKKVLIAIGIILTIIYCINGGLYSLLFDLRESKTVIIYSIVVIVLLALLIFLNISDENGKSDKQKDISSYLTVGIIIVACIFGLLLIFTLIDFFLPIIVLSIILTVSYFLSKKLIVMLADKRDIK